MSMPGFVKFGGAAAALALCAACAGWRSVAPPKAAFDVEYVDGMASVNGRLVTAMRPHSSARSPYAVLAPDRLPDAQIKHFEYIINDYGTYASIFNYPRSVNQIGSITDVGGQGCTNVLYGYGNKYFWIVAAYNQIEKFRVPKKPLRTLSDSAGMPSSCAMSNGGNLAVGVLDGPGSGDVVVYKNAQGTGIAYATGLAREYFDGYDAGGNLFADGFTNDYTFALEELPKGAKAFRTVSTSNSVIFPGSVQWDGKFLTVTDQSTNSIYRYKIVGAKATLKGTVSLSGSSDCAQTWIATGVVYCADAGIDDGEVFSYPAGGSPLAVFSGNFDLPLGTTAAHN